MHLGGVVEYLVGADAQEADEHQLDDRPHAGGRGADSGTYETGLGYGCVTHTLGAELAVEAPAELEDASPSILHARTPGGASDVLTHHEDGGITLHLLPEGLVDGPYVRKLPDGLLCLDHISSLTSILSLRRGE